MGLLCTLKNSLTELGETYICLRFLIGGSINGVPSVCLVELDSAYLDEPARSEEALLSC